MSIEFREPRREAAPVLVGISGPSGGGKTYSALRFARGLANGQPFAVIDTENGRALHYADFFPEMRHAHLRAPFSPAAYTEAIDAADAQGFPVIVVDSASHEWEGDGGVLKMQEAEFARMGSKDSARMASWIAPKTAHKDFVRRLLQVKAHVVLCMRAEDKVEMVKVNGKSEVRAKETLTSILGWIPICERRLPFELTASLLVLPDAPGVPKVIKLQEQHRPFFPLDKPISEEAGAALAAWAAGGQSAAPDATPSDAGTSSEGGAATSAPGAADISEEEELLAKALLTIADSVGNRDVTVKAIEKNRSDPAHSQQDRVAWLRKQLERAQAVVA
jgi:hypothetical protein